MQSTAEPVQILLHVQRLDRTYAKLSTTLAINATKIPRNFICKQYSNACQLIQLHGTACFVNGLRKCASHVQYA